MEKGDREEPAREAGSGTGVGGGCQMPKRGQRERDRSSFSPQKVVTFLGVQKERKSKKKWLQRQQKTPGPGSAAAEMTIQSQDTAEDCTAGSAELGGSAANAGAARQAVPECLVLGAACPL